VLIGRCQRGRGVGVSAVLTNTIPLALLSALPADWSTFENDLFQGCRSTC